MEASAEWFSANRSLRSVVIIVAEYDGVELALTSFNGRSYAEIPDFELVQGLGDFQGYRVITAILRSRSELGEIQRLATLQQALVVFTLPGMIRKDLLAVSKLLPASFTGVAPPGA